MSTRRPKIRANAQPLVKLIADCGISLDLFEPGSDGWYEGDDLARQFAAAYNANVARRRAAAGAQPWGDLDPVDWARASGRIAASSVAAWHARHRADPAGIEQVLRDLSPVLTSGPEAGPWIIDSAGNYALATRDPSSSSTPLLDQVERALFGAPEAERVAEERIAAERELSELEERERAQAAANHLTPGERERLFGRRKDH